MELAKLLLGYHSFDIGIHFIGDEEMRTLNREMMGKDVPTDIISIGFLSDRQLGAKTVQERQPVDIFEDYDLGEIHLNIPYLYRLYPAVHMHDVLVRLSIHGLCHLSGDVHDEDEDADRMIHREYGLYRCLQRVF